MCGKKSPVGLIAFILVMVGALSWGLVGLGMLMNGDMNWNLVNMLLGQWMKVEAVVYLLVGLAAVYKLAMCGKHCGGCCKGGMCSCGNPNCDGSCMKKDTPANPGM